MMVCLDPGHQKVPDYEKEPISPKSELLKAKCARGTYGTFSKEYEYEITLNIALFAKGYLEEYGHKVFLTRNTNDASISNVERAKYANEHNVEFCVKIHCNGVRDSLRYVAFWRRGLLTLIPKRGCVSDDVYEKSKAISRIIHQKMLATTEFPDKGVRERGELTGFNWSEVPVVLLELGYLTNPTEERKLVTKVFQDKVAQAISQGIIDAYNAINI